MTQRVAITGASGLIGGALSSSLLERGDEVVHLVRRAPRTSSEVRWDPGSPLDPGALDGVDAVVNLAGAGIADHRWSAEYRATIRRSRLDSTRTLVRALAGLGRPVRLVSGSAIGVYGDDRGEALLPETASCEPGFLPDVCRDWEAEAMLAARDGHQVALARTGIVLSTRGGALAKTLPLAKAGLAGPLGTGEQWWAWISLEDEVAALTFLLDHPEITGPVNLVAPEAARQKDVFATLARLVSRPYGLPAPAAAIKFGLGGMSTELLGSRHVVPEVLTDAGFAFSRPDVESTLAAEVTRS